MTAAQLARLLTTFPADAEVWLVWDGAPRSVAEVAWLTRTGIVAVSPAGETVGFPEDWPADFRAGSAWPDAGEMGRRE